MIIHEYQAKRLLARFGVSVPQGAVAYTAEEAGAIARRLGGEGWYVKPQRLGLGASAISFAATPDAVVAAAERLLGRGADGAGSAITRILVEETLPPARALALALSVDTGEGLVACAVGESAHANRSVAERADFHCLLIDPTLGPHPHHARRLAHRLGLLAPESAAFARCFRALYDALIALDASRVEVDPLLAHETRGMVAAGIAMAIDDNALFRQDEVAELRETEGEAEAEREAERHGLNYLRLCGSIGCLANGAGLAMATMDTLYLHGGEPANFLDIGGGATRERVAAAFKVVLTDPHVEGVLLNVFGGVLRCEVIAEGIVAAARGVGLHVPLAVRLEGTNAELGRKVLRQSSLPILCADTIEEAAERVVAAVREAA